MVYTVYVHNKEDQPRITITDDRGVPAVNLSLATTNLTEVEAELSANGWEVTADWTKTRDGLRAPAVIKHDEPSWENDVDGDASRPTETRPHD